MSSSSTRCAGCKYLRRRCPPDCVLAPYFPSSNPQRFACVHKIFGASNVSKFLLRLPVHLRTAAADCMSMEARKRVEDPVYGCVGTISQLQQEIIAAESELAKVGGEIVFHNAQKYEEKSPSWFSESQLRLFQLEQREDTAASEDQQGGWSWLNAIPKEEQVLGFFQLTDEM